VEVIPGGGGKWMVVIESKMLSWGSGADGWWLLNAENMKVPCGTGETRIRVLRGNFVVMVMFLPSFRRKT